MTASASGPSAIPLAHRQGFPSWPLRIVTAKAPMAGSETVKGITMTLKQQVDVALKISLWLDATMNEDEIVTRVRSALPLAFGEALTGMKDPVDIIDVKQEAEIYGNRVLSPDPEGMNDERSAWAAAALAAFITETGTDEEGARGDLLGDLMHWCDRNNYDFEAMLSRARGHYEAETMEESV